MTESEAATSQRARLAAVLIACSVVVQIALTVRAGGVPTLPSWLLAHSLLSALVFLGLPVAAAVLLLRRRVDLGTALLLPTAAMSAFRLLSWVSLGLDLMSQDVGGYLLQAGADVLLLAAAAAAWTSRYREHWAPARSWSAPYLAVALVAVALGSTGDQLWWLLTTGVWPFAELVAGGVGILLVAALLAVAGILRRLLGGAVLLATIAPAVLGSVALILGSLDPQFGPGLPPDWTTFLGFAAELVLLGVAVWWLTFEPAQSPATKNRHSPSAEMPTR